MKVVKENVLNPNQEEGCDMINHYQQRTRGPVHALHRTMLQG